MKFNRSARHLAILASGFLFACFTVPLLLGTMAFADVAAAPAGASTDTILGWVLKGVLTLTILAGGWGAVKLSGFLLAKTQQTNMNSAQSLTWSLTNRIWLKAQAVGGKLIAKEKALLEKILADGVVTPDEFVAFKSAIATDLREIATEEIPALSGLIGGQGPITALIEGFASKVAHNLISGQTGAPTQSPLVNTVPAPVAASPS